MKKIYVLLVVSLAVIGSVQAQRKVGAAHSVKTLKNTSGSFTNGIQGGGCDTINYPFPGNWNLTVYSLTSPGSGYVSGTNSTDDKQKANYFDLSATSDSYITGTAVYFGYANSSNSANLSKYVYFKVYADDNGTPSTQLGVDSLPLSALKTDVDSGFISSITFTNPIVLPASKKFYVSVDFSNLSFEDGDTLALVETSDGDLAAGTGTAYEQWSDDSWHNFNDPSTWNFDAALVILPFVSTTEGACGILPVNLVSFDAVKQNKDVLLNWKVADEINMKGYQLEKADNNNNYKPVAYLQAHNSAKTPSYSYTDINATSTVGNIQYRLKLIDNDGKVQYSKIVSIKAASAVNNVTFTNPFNGTLRMQLNLANAAQVKINVYDVRGNLVGSEKPASYAASSNSIELKSTAALQSGMYIIKVLVGNEQLNYKVIKQ